MAKFLKVATTSAAGVVGETLIPIDQYGGMVATNTLAGANAITTLVITTSTSATSLYTIILSAPIAGPATVASRQADMLAAFNSALIANPGGVVSTVGSPVSIAQAPLAQSGLQGRQPITIAQVNITYTSATYVA